ncbi:DNA ligase [Alteromonas gracilis]|uniref:DNA ligase n=1 Tax=Alteromonas gracilis TaxID=1479524 RepID=UPI0030CC6185
MIKYKMFSACAASIIVAAHSYAVTDIAPLQLATTFHAEQDTIGIQNYWVSEKLDGIRARWTGSQLLTRNGVPIHAPVWFTKDWPNVALDGELWIARGRFEQTASVVLSYQPDERWRSVVFKVFDLPSSDASFESRLKTLRLLIDNQSNTSLSLIAQHKYTSLRVLEHEHSRVIAAGGEGLMLHNQNALYHNGRSPDLLKFKRYEDNEAKVIAHVRGNGKYSDMMGSLIVQTKDGVTFKLGTGFSEAQRLSPPPINSWVTYKFYGKTRYGKPRFASFLRQRDSLDMPR